MSERVKKINSLSQKIISEILEKDIDLPLAKKFLYSVAEVKVSPDLHVAEVFISILCDKEKTEEAFYRLNRHIFKIQMLYGDKIRLKNTPRIHLNLDTTAQYAARIDELINVIHKNEIKP